MLRRLCLSVGDVGIVPGGDAHTTNGQTHELRVIQQPLRPAGRTNINIVNILKRDNFLTGDNTVVRDGHGKALNEIDSLENNDGVVLGRVPSRHNVPL
eukprot:8569790-Heterocapsa_arctica.AAC.1